MIKNNKTKQVKDAIHMAGLKAVTEICLIMEADAVLGCPVNFGQLRSSIGFTTPLRQKGNLPLPAGKVGIVGTNVEYAPHVEFGTGPHKIIPKNATVLSWVEGRYRHFAKYVWHPGTKAQPFMRPAFERVRGMVTGIFQKHSDSELGQV